MKPLGMKIGTIQKGTSVFSVRLQQHVMLSQTLTRINLIARRNNEYEFVFNGYSYIVHADNVTLH